MSHIVQPDSVLASTAAELHLRHQPGPGDHGVCPACGWPSPCAAGSHAGLVLAATPGSVTEPAAMIAA